MKLFLDRAESFKLKFTIDEQPSKNSIAISCDNYRDGMSIIGLAEHMKVNNGVKSFNYLLINPKYIIIKFKTRPKIKDKSEELVARKDAAK